MSITATISITIRTILNIYFIIVDIITTIATTTIIIIIIIITTILILITTFEWHQVVMDNDAQVRDMSLFTLEGRRKNDHVIYNIVIYFILSSIIQNYIILYCYFMVLLYHIILLNHNDRLFYASYCHLFYIVCYHTML